MSDFFNDNDYVISGVVKKFSDRLFKTMIWYSQVEARFDIEKIDRRTIQIERNLQKWKTTANVATTTSGGILSLLSVFGLAIDVVAIVDGWVKTSIGIGCIIAQEYGYSWREVDNSDFANIVAYWVGMPELVGKPEGKKMNMERRFSKKSVQKVSVKASTKFGAKFLLKFSEKVGIKLGSKFSSLVPVAGSGANALVNRIFMGEVMDATEKYYHDKFFGLLEEDTNPDS